MSIDSKQKLHFATIWGHRVTPLPSPHCKITKRGAEHRTFSEACTGLLTTALFSYLFNALTLLAACLLGSPLYCVVLLSWLFGACQWSCHIWHFALMRACNPKTVQADAPFFCSRTLCLTHRRFSSTHLLSKLRQINDVAHFFAFLAEPSLTALPLNWVSSERWLLALPGNTSAFRKRLLVWLKSQRWVWLLDAQQRLAACQDIAVQRKRF